ncbi:hypothetical protein ACFS5N_03790 [Mucilaginibacter ximonensis]|uniref:Coproporphyrinogen III oxidase n=1 Tax=Mucilaginibacter ximonensis TaxID=538021 RepID=A0ABW5Y8I9_9SPHI
MKRQILNFALATAIFGIIATGCSSEKKAGNSDSTAVDTASMDSAKKAKMMKKQMQKDTATPAKTIEDTVKP